MDEKLKKENNRKDYKGRKANKRSTKRGGDRIDTKGDCSRPLDNNGRDNDPNWYFLDANVADQAATFSFNQFLGTDVSVRGLEFKSGSPAPVAADYSLRVPSILVASCNPSAGSTKDKFAGINLAALKTYTQLSARNAKTTNYAPQDITILVLAMGELLSIVEHIRRAFGVAFTYNQRNRSLPVRLLNCMGFNADEFLTNLADKRLEFNSWITAINKIPFPTNFSYVYKCVDMYQKVYADSESAMAQLVFMRPYSTWVLDETTSDKGGYLSTRELPQIINDADGTKTWELWSSIVTSQINALMESATYNYVYADVLMLHDKYSMPLMKLDYLTSDYYVLPEYNRNFMLQIHNARAVGKPFVSASGAFTKFNDVEPDPNLNRVNYRPGFLVPNVSKYIRDALIDFDTPDASVVDRIEATRYCAIMETDGIATAGEFNVVSYQLPDHYIVDFNVIIGNGDPNKQGDVHILNYDNNCGQDEYLNGAITQIDWAPIIFGMGNMGKDKAFNIYGDLNYWTFLPIEWFDRVNDITFQALFELR